MLTRYGEDYSVQNLKKVILCLKDQKTICCTTKATYCVMGSREARICLEERPEWLAINLVLALTIGVLWGPKEALVKR